MKVCAAFRGTSQTEATLRLLARRYQTLSRETEIKQLCAQANPALLAAPGIGPETAAALLVSPIGVRSVVRRPVPGPASSGHTINRGGGAKKLSTLRASVREIIRCLKRYIRVYHLLTNPPQTPSPISAATRNTHMTLAQAATALHAIQQASHNSNEASTPTTSLPDTKHGSPTPQTRFAKHRSISTTCASCSRCHHNVHDRDWQIEQTPTGAYRLRPPPTKRTRPPHPTYQQHRRTLHPAKQRK